MAEVVEGRLAKKTFDDADEKLLDELNKDPDVLSFGKRNPYNIGNQSIPPDDELADAFDLPSAPTTTIIPKKLQSYLQNDIKPLENSISELQTRLTTPNLPQEEQTGIKRDINILQDKIQYLRQTTRNVASAPFAPTTKIRAGKRTKKQKRSKTKRKRKNRITNRYRKYLFK